ncbi:MAG TPA: response regulator [Sandaracinaceae bacterium LLY-WYZ-13_1]|nr:response regulator [Sandaracinaceae bacterium LLY-WYZ-13_1]
MSERVLRVLVVDDDEQQLELVQRSLARHRFDVRTSASPIGVSNLVRDFSPDLLLIDVNQPALSGDRLLTLVRRNTRSRARLVLYSASDVDRLRQLAEDVSADAWIQKGLAAKELATRLRAICEEGS